MDNDRHIQEQRPLIGLVLGAGSARGLAHIGVLQVLAENSIPFDFIVGSSMGAMIGGIYACGADLYMSAKMLEHLDTSILLDVNLPRMGFIAGKKITSFLDLLTKKKDFADTRMPLFIVTTDLVSGQRVVINSGSISEAIRASISIPGVFNPVRKDEMVLVDGAVVDRLPVEVAREQGAEVIIAVDVTFGEGKQVVIKNALDVIWASLDIMQKQQFDLVSPQADIIIQPEVGGFSSRDFDKSAELIQLGRKAAEEKLSEIRAKIGRKKQELFVQRGETDVHNTE
ncbi:MAG: patatin-like phospholipase family protein [Syntrophomonadaceae bacterium]